MQVLDWTSHAAIAVVVAVGIFVYGFISGLIETKKERKEAWQRLPDAFDGVTVRRVMNAAPTDSADRLDYAGVPFLGAFELTKDVLRFYRFKVKNGSIIEFPVHRIRESIRLENHHEPAATLTIGAPDGRQFTTDAVVPESLCTRLVRLANESGSSPE